MMTLNQYFAAKVLCFRNWSGIGTHRCLTYSPKDLAKLSSLLEELTPSPRMPYTTKWTALISRSSTRSTQ